MSKETWFWNVIWEPLSETDAQRYVKASKSALRDVYVENKGKKHTHIGRKRENSPSKLPKSPDLHPQKRHKTNTYSYYSWYTTILDICTYINICIRRNTTIWNNKEIRTRWMKISLTKNRMILNTAIIHISNICWKRETNTYLYIHII